MIAQWRANLCIINQLIRKVMIQEILVNEVPVKMWVNHLDEYAWEETRNLAALPFVFHHLALMPDAHAGKGMPIGAVLATKGVVVPNAVGVDIGCGMCAVKSNIRVEDITGEVLRKQILRGIRKQIPLGREHHKQRQDENLMPQGFDTDRMTVVKRQLVSAQKQVGTLGGGNHFIELQCCEEGFLWVMIHSGSRNLGLRVGDYYNHLAEMLNARWHSSVSPEVRLAFLPMHSAEAKQYWAEMEYCIAFALANRKLMMDRIQEVICEAIPEAVFEPMINIAHNYAAWERHYGEDVIVHRKGAVHAGLGQVGIIPGSQGTKSYIVEGLGHEDSFCSSSHGAGRAMSRKEAVRTLSLEVEIARLEALGIIHAIRSPRDLEEATGAYKNIDEVMANQRDLVKIRTELSPIAVIKG